MRSRRRRFRLLPSVAVAMAMASALGGCSGGGPAADGPLNINDSIPLGSNCGPGGHAWAFGFDQFTNHGRATVVLDRVVLLHPRNEQLLGSFAVPGDRIVGAANWPVRNFSTQPAWKDRQPVHGFRLAPGKTFNMVLGIAAVAGGYRATSQGEIVYYHDSSGSYLTKSQSAMIIAANTHTC
jgi:hypothetical protein